MFNDKHMLDQYLKKKRLTYVKIHTAVADLQPKKVS